MIAVRRPCRAAAMVTLVGAAAEVLAERVDLVETDPALQRVEVDADATDGEHVEGVGGCFVLSSSTRYPMSLHIDIVSLGQAPKRPASSPVASISRLAALEPLRVGGHCHTCSMDPILSLLLGLLAGLIVGAAAGGFAVVTLLRRRADSGAPAVVVEDPAVVAARHEAELAQARAAEAAIRAEISSDLAAAQATVDSLKDQVLAQQEQYREVVERHRAEAQAQPSASARRARCCRRSPRCARACATMQQKVTELETQRSRAARAS